MIAAPNVSTIYELPLRLHEEGLDQTVIERLNIWSREPDLSAWERTVEKVKSPKSTVHVDGKNAEQLLKLMEEVEELDDVQKVWANFDIDVKDMAASA